MRNTHAPPHIIAYSALFRSARNLRESPDSLSFSLSLSLSASLENWIGKDKTSLLTKGSRHWKESFLRPQPGIPSVYTTPHKVQVSRLRIILFRRVPPNGRSRTRATLFSYMYDFTGDITADRTATKIIKGKTNISRYTSLRSLTRCDITKEVHT